jgi:hypothetical protein
MYVSQRWTKEVKLWIYFEIFFIRAQGEMEDPILLWGSQFSPASCSFPASPTTPTIATHTGLSLAEDTRVFDILPTSASPPQEVSGDTRSSQSPRISETASDLRPGMVVLHRGGEPDHLLVLWFFDMRPGCWDTDRQRSLNHWRVPRFCWRLYFVTFWHGGPVLNIRVTHVRLDMRRNFFSLRVIEDWNKIPAEVKRLRKSEIFRRTYKQLRAGQLRRT